MAKFFDSFNPVLWCYVFIGIDFKSSPGNLQFFRALSIIVKFIFVCILVISSGLAVELYATEGGLHLDDLSNLTGVLFTFLKGIGIYVAFTWKKADFEKLFRDMDTAAETIVGYRCDTNDNFKKLRIKMKVALFFLVVVYGVFAALLAMKLYAEPLYGSSKIKEVLFEISISISVFIYAFSVYFYEMLGLFIVTIFDQLYYPHRTMRDPWTSWNQKLFKYPKQKLWEVATFMKHHETLCSLVQLTDEVFREIALIWSAAEMFNIVVMVRNMNLNEFPDIRFDLILPTIVLTFNFLCKSIVAAVINNEVRGVGRISWTKKKKLA